MAYAS
jgi:hypothetical protein